MLAPLALRAGDDRAAFLSELAAGVEVDTWDPRADRVSLLTLHAAKGLEFDVVFVAGCEDGIVPLRFGDDCDVAEERRLFFVGMTRARRRLVLSHARRRLWQGQMRDCTPSPFLRDIEQRLLERSQTREQPARRVKTQLDLF
jgi:DNA helicase-2/ATP-dependent DNA helicase PcrA